MIYNDRFYKLEMLLLAILQHHDCTCDDLVEIINQKAQDTLQPKAGIVFTSLFCFKTTLLVSSYIKNDEIYYHIESPGLVRLETLKRRYQNMQKAIHNVLQYQGDTYE